MRVFLLVLSLLCLVGANSQSTLFSAVNEKQSGISFANMIQEDEKVNILKYDYLYNGAGVGVGDFDRNGLPDLFFAGNQAEDELYLNQGKFNFKLVNKEAGIDSHGWSTGVCVFDVNADGWDDIYVLRSGPSQDTSVLKNVLYVNQKNGTFKEEAAKYGLDLSGHHTQAAPLDIDLDGDLDLYIMGHPGKFKHKVNLQEVIADIRAGKVESDLLLENLGGTYVDITEDAGINEFGYGLGLAITDVNEDRYPDIIVCNDFDEPDHLFINQQNNTFIDKNLEYFQHTSNYSMGNDVGDINNDGLLDYISVDMAFEHHERSKTNMASMNPQKFFARVQLGWGYQYMHNMLHLNTGMGKFQEIAQFAGVAKTDWSWAPLLFDMNQDGKKDLFITNGYKRDTKNNDIGMLLAEAKDDKGELSIQEFLDLIPAVKIENFFFENVDGIHFKDQRKEWGVDERLNSNGAAYVDLDLDGDLDLVLNNVDTLASIYENTSEPSKYRIGIDFSELPQSLYSGAKITVKSKGIQVQEAHFVRGYCSTMEKKIQFYSDSPFRYVQIELADGRTFDKAELEDVSDLKLTPDFKGFKEVEISLSEPKTYFKDVTEDHRLDLVYIENQASDFERESLLPHMMSTQGPEVAVGDFNKDGLDDFVVTSPVGKIPTVLLQNRNQTFKKILSRSFYNHHSTEDADVVTFDINGDKNLDLFITSGGYEYPEGDTTLENRLYIGNGLGMFGFVNNGILSKDLTNSGKIIPFDLENDGDQDLLICGKAYPGKYPYPGKTKILVNEKGFFLDKTKDVAPQIEFIGMVNDACFSDLDYDGDQDILLVGEWMNIEWMENMNGKFVHRPNNIGFPGWWTRIIPVDTDNDGDDDYILGNAGMNNKFKASKSNPLDVYANDFDDNGTLDIVLAYSKEDRQLPVRGRECSSGQMPFISEKFPTFISFANSELEEIYGKEKLERSLHYAVTEFRSGVMYNNGAKGLSFEPFPDEAQFSFLNDFEVIDINQDSLPDIIGVGNRFNTEVETTRYDAGCGVVLIQNEDGTFTYLPPRDSGFYAPNNAKSITRINLGGEGKVAFLIGNNNHRLQLIEWTP